MKTTAAFLVQECNDDEKRLLQQVHAVYSHTYKGWFITDEQRDKMKDMPPPQEKPSTIFIDDLGDSLKVYGDTYRKKDELKQMGARWSPSDRSWRIDKHKFTLSELDVLAS